MWNLAAIFVSILFDRLFCICEIVLAVETSISFYSDSILNAAVIASGRQIVSFKSNLTFLIFLLKTVIPANRYNSVHTHS